MWCRDWIAPMIDQGHQPVGLYGYQGLLKNLSLVRIYENGEHSKTRLGSVYWGEDLSGCLWLSRDILSRVSAMEVCQLFAELQPRSQTSWFQLIWFFFMPPFSPPVSHLFDKSLLSPLSKIQKKRFSSHYAIALSFPCSQIVPSHESLREENVWRWLWYSWPPWEGSSGHGWSVQSPT